MISESSYLLYITSNALLWCARNINFSLQFSSTLHFNSIDVVRTHTRQHPSIFCVKMNRYSFYPFIAYHAPSFLVYLLWKTIQTICWHVAVTLLWVMLHTKNYIFTPLTRLHFNSIKHVASLSLNGTQLLFSLRVYFIAHLIK